VLTRDTEYGMVSWEQLESGWTHGVPGATHPQLETRLEEGWTQVRLPADVISELLRTPGFSTWQGDTWLFHGTDPLVFVGEWSRSDFEARCPSGVSPSAFFASIVRHSEPATWDSLEGIGVYVFRDAKTGKFDGYYDFD
jgi:uncharacterized protein CbrC (UPF0167 family)